MSSITSNLHQEAVKLTTITPGDDAAIIASKQIASLVLKICVVALASLEMLSLLTATFVHFLIYRTPSNITAQAQSVGSTTFEALTHPFATYGRQEEKPHPNSQTHSSPIRYSQATLFMLKNNPKLTLLAASFVVTCVYALYFSSLPPDTFPPVTSTRTISYYSSSISLCGVVMTGLYVLGGQCYKKYFCNKEAHQLQSNGFIDESNEKTDDKWQSTKDALDCRFCRSELKEIKSKWYSNLNDLCATEVVAHQWNQEKTLSSSHPKYLIAEDVDFIQKNYITIEGDGEWILRESRF